MRGVLGLFYFLHLKGNLGKADLREAPDYLIVTVLLSLVRAHGDKTHTFTHLIYYFLLVILIFFGVIL